METQQVRLSVQYPSKSLNKNVGKALAHGVPSRIATAVMNCLPVRNQSFSRLLLLLLLLLLVLLLLLLLLLIFSCSKSKEKQNCFFFSSNADFCNRRHHSSICPEKIPQQIARAYVGSYWETSEQQRDRNLQCCYQQFDGGISASNRSD